MATIYGCEVVPAVGSVIRPDGWRFAHRLEASRWDAAAFVLPTGHDCGITGLSVNVEVTGRTWQRREGDYWVRVRVEFVGDGEPSTFSSGWMMRV